MNFGELLNELYDVENELYHMNLYATKMSFGMEGGNPLRYRGAALRPILPRPAPASASAPEPEMMGWVFPGDPNTMPPPPPRPPRPPNMSSQTEEEEKRRLAEEKNNLRAISDSGKAIRLYTSFNLDPDKPFADNFDELLRYNAAMTRQKEEEEMKALRDDPELQKTLDEIIDSDAFDQET